MPFVSEDRRVGAGTFRRGLSNTDADKFIERGVVLPVLSDPAASWVYFDCTVGCMLDSGIVVHNRLPQVDNAPDTLAHTLVGLDDPNFDRIVPQGGVNLRCNDQYSDIVQRMGHARYWFRIWGQALRFAHQIPIPGIKTIGGVPAIPYDENPQWAFNRIAPGGVYTGVILWHAMWSLWYTTAIPPRSNVFPSADPAMHVRGDARVPAAAQAAISQSDDDSVPAAPPAAAPVAPRAARPVR